MFTNLHQCYPWISRFEFQLFVAIPSENEKVLWFGAGGSAGVVPVSATLTSKAWLKHHALAQNPFMYCFSCEFQEQLRTTLEGEKVRWFEFSLQRHCMKIFYTAKVLFGTSVFTKPRNRDLQPTCPQTEGLNIFQAMNHKILPFNKVFISFLKPLVEIHKSRFKLPRFMLHREISEVFGIHKWFTRKHPDSKEIQQAPVVVGCP